MTCKNLWMVGERNPAKRQEVREKISKAKTGRPKFHPPSCTCAACQAKRGMNWNSRFNLTKNELARLYHNEKLSMPQIATKLGLDYSTIHKWMVKLEVRIRSKVESRKEQIHKENCQCGICKANRGEPWNKGLTKEENQILAKISKDLRIRRANHSWGGNQAGENNPRWKGGYEPYYGPNWRQAKREVLRRDNYRCQICGRTSLEIGKNSDVHHIVPFNNFGLERYREANDPSNLTSLCPSCHSREQRIAPLMRPRIQKNAPRHRESGGSSRGHNSGAHKWYQ